MKKSILYLMMMVLSLSAFPAQMMAAEKDPITVATNPNEIPADVQAKLARLDEINAMDKSSLTRSEKRTLRKEVKAINASLKSNGTNIYYAVGALIIILIVLIPLVGT